MVFDPEDPLSMLFFWDIISLFMPTPSEKAYHLKPKEFHTSFIEPRNHINMAHAIYCKVKSFV